MHFRKDNKKRTVVMNYGGDDDDDDDEDSRPSAHHIREKMASTSRVSRVVYGDATRQDKFNFVVDQGGRIRVGSKYIILIFCPSQRVPH